jgi:hypothetical protein
LYLYRFFYFHHNFQYKLGNSAVHLHQPSLALDHFKDSSASLGSGAAA